MQIFYFHRYSICTYVKRFKVSHHLPEVCANNHCLRDPFSGFAHIRTDVLQAWKVLRYNKIGCGSEFVNNDERAFLCHHIYLLQEQSQLP